MNNFKNKKKYFVLAAILLFAVSCGFVFPKKAQAIPVEVTADATMTAIQVKQALTDAAMDSWRMVAIQALVTALDTASQTVAKNFATWLATGGAAKGPMAWLNSLGTIAKQSYENAASDFLNTLAVKYTGYGLCQPINPQITLNIKLGIFRDLQPPKPKCTWSQMVKNYDTLKGTLSSGAFLKNFSVAFQPAQNEIDNAITLHYNARNQAQNASDLAKIDATKAGGYKDLTNIISGNIKTPASMVRTNVELGPVTAGEKDVKKAEANISYIGVAKSALSGIAANAGRMFLNTLATKLLEKYTKGGMFSMADIICKTRLAGELDVCKKNGASGVSETAVTQGANAVALANAYYSSIFAPTPSTDSNFSMIADLQACPAGSARNIYNCAIDQQFAALLQKQSSGGYLTLDEALKQGLLADKPIVGKGDQKDGLSNCYVDNYCYSNLRKLRRADIIPVGWEMAASSPKLTSGITLGYVKDHFNECNDAGVLDNDHPWCHLIDPDWVMKIPLEQCNALVNGQTPTGANSPERSQTCADISTCISEDTNGKCTGGYGYCTRETGGWSVDADSCPAQYASCESYAKANLADNESDANGAWLKNTLDAKSCSATTAGCRAFAVSQTKGDWVDRDRLYLTTSAPVCEATAAGCKTFEDAATATTQNLLPNPSFETATSDGVMAESWTKDWEAAGASRYEHDATNSFDGIASYYNAGILSLGGYHNLNGTVDIGIEPNKLYTLSFYAKAAVANPQDGNLEIKIFDRPFIGPQDDVCPAYYPFDQAPKPTCVQDLSLAALTPTCTTTAGANFSSCALAPGGDYGPKNAHGEIKVGFPLLQGYERYTVTFATPPGDARYIGLYLSAPSPYYIDAFQLEQSPTATPFHVGGSDLSGAATNFKAPPDYLNCTGDKNADDSQCNSYATVCRATEAGCDGYTPAGGGARIPGIVSPGDTCPATCVGYNTFKQESTQWEVPATDASRFPEYFIPSTGKTCALPDVGCDEFTNLEQVAAGGESKNYFTFLRACRKSDPTNEATFFVWEGSDASGYQLKSYVLRTGPASDSRMDILSAAGDTKPTNGPAYIHATDAASCTAAIVNLAATDPNYNPDCREFINAAGDRFYRLLSRTISSTDECKNFRKTASTQPDCEGTGGTWNNDVCEYEGLPAESKTCDAQVNGCRYYTGNNGANTETVLSDDFESGLSSWGGASISGEATAVGGHSLAVSGAVIGKPLSGTSAVKKGKSYTLTVWAKGSGAFSAGIDNSDGSAVHYFNGEPDKVVNLTSDWQRYVLGPLFVNWDPPGDYDSYLNIYTSGLAANNFDYFDNISLVATTDQFALIKDSWKTPAECDQTADGAPLPQAQLGCAAYNNTAGKVVDLKSFTNLCRDNVIGCKAYVDRAGTASPFAYTYNARCVVASAASAPTDCTIGGKTLCTIPANNTYCRFNKEGVLPASGNGFTIVSDPGTSAAPDLFTVSADTVRYYVVKEENKCEKAEVGCTELGSIAYGKTAKCDNGTTCNSNNGCACTIGNSILETKTSPKVACFVAKDATSCLYSVDPNAQTNAAIAPVYRIVKPDDFVQGDLCVSDAVGCDAWNASDKTTQYFKNPGDMLCEYKSGGSSGAVSGWFKKGTGEPCDPKYIVNGSNLGIHRNLDTYYADFAGVCSDDVAGCTEYRDSFDQSIPGGKPYFFIKNGKIDDANAACTEKGGASNKKGCILFNDQSNPSLPWSAATTYADSAAHNFDYRPALPAANGSTDVNDSNIILEAQLDRVCTEWLECKSWETVKNPSISQCLALGVCTQKDSAGNCSAWQAGSKVLLSTGNYSSRPVVFGAADYTGYSIPGLVSLGQGKQTLTSATNSNPAVRIFQINGGGSGITQSCKSYPEVDSPFPANAAPVGANVCEHNDKTPPGKDCECSYRKVSYGSTVKYFEPTAEAGVTKDFVSGEIPSAICTDGSYIGQECSVYASGDRTDVNQSCASGNDEGTCSAISKIQSSIGGKGYCLETDDSLTAAPNGPGACLTWLPIDQPNGRDPNSLFAAAGFLATPGQESYCAAPLKVCVPVECANNYHGRDFTSNTMVPPICSELRNTTLNGATQGCFTSCGGDQACQSAQNAQCSWLVNNFCWRIGGAGGGKATGTITIVSVPATGKTVSIGSATFTAGASGNLGFDNTGDINATATSLADAINNILNHPLGGFPVAASPSNNVVTVTATSSGSPYNYSLSTNDPTDITFSGRQMITINGSQSFNGTPTPPATSPGTVTVNGTTFTEGTDFTATPGKPASTAASLAGAIINSPLALGKGAPLNVSSLSNVLILTPVAPATPLTISTNDSANIVPSGTSMTGGTDGTTKEKWCGDVITSYPECTTFKAATPNDPGNTTYCLSAFNACTEYIKFRQDNFCAPLSANNCLVNYGMNASCPARAQDFCGPYVIDNCAASGKISDGKFCGNTNTCGQGEECVAVNDLTAHQTEYNLQESKEGAVLMYTGAGNFNYMTGQTEGDTNIYFTDTYNAIPEPGAHTYLNSVELAGLPVLSSASLVFKPLPPAEGVQNDWAGWNGDSPVNIAPDADKTTKLIQSYPNDLIGMFSILSPSSSEGNISIDYEMTSPGLLFTSQLERATFRVLTYQNNGMGRYGIGAPYGPNADGSDLIQWTCSNIIEHKQIARNPSNGGGTCANGDTYPAGLFDSNNGSYGYWLFSGGDDWQFNTTKSCPPAPADPKATAGTCTTTNTAPYDFILTNGNGWTAQASSAEGELTISLRLSDSEPKRIIGVHIDAKDTNANSHGYFYLSNIDFKMVGDQSGAICGEAAYAGSSNALAEDNTNSANHAGTYGLAKTRWFNSATNGLDSATDTKGGLIKYTNKCSPWGAFAIANPSTIVTAGSSNCEISKAAIYKNITELLKVFARILGVGLFNDDVSTRETDTYFTYQQGLNTGNNVGPNGSGLNTGISTSFANPTISGFTINDASAGYLPGRGSLRANIKFYASAADDQLPLKNVKINWDNSTPNDYYDSGPNNFYKNHKEPGSADACSIGAANSVDTADNCDPSAFTYSHVYSCTPPYNFAADRNYPEIGLLQSATPNACKFTPSLTVTDNWGKISTQLLSPVSIIVAPN